jgi:hypothetical protein
VKGEKSASFPPCRQAGLRDSGQKQVDFSNIQSKIKYTLIFEIQKYKSNFQGRKIYLFPCLPAGRL